MINFLSLNNSFEDLIFHDRDRAQIIGRKGKIALSKMDAKAIVYAVQKELSISAW